MIKIIVFGQSFSPTTVPQTLHTALPVRAPEVLFKDTIDCRVAWWVNDRDEYDAAVD